MNKKVVVGFSGGKDSTAALIILKKKGYDVHALTMKIGLNGEEENIEKIGNLANILEVPLKVLDVKDIFKEKVIDYFINSYKSGITPNPCVICNKEVKFKILKDFAFIKERADFYATGHYANRIEIHGEFFLKEPAEKEKSQNYFLSMINRKDLKNIIFPLADVKINEVKRIVKDLTLANIKESQDICFLQHNSLTDYLKKYLLSDAFKKGDILDVKGNKIGTHNGALYFTIGQRRGTKFSSDRKQYVIKKDINNNTIYLGEEKLLYSNDLIVKKPVFWRKIERGELLKVKVRYLSKSSEAYIIEVSDDFIKARFKAPKRAVTPGQIGVFYDKDIIVASGYIV